MKRTTFLVLVFTFALIVTHSTFNSASAQEFKTYPLYSFLSAKGYRLYKVGATLPPGLSDGPWKNEGVVAYVLKDPAAGSHPVYTYVKTDQWGTRYSYNRKDSESGNGWNLQGVAFHLPPQGTPNTVRLFKLYLPAQQTHPGKEFTGMVQGTDAVYLTSDAGKRAEAIGSGWQGAGVLGVAWTKPLEAPALADLVIKQTSVEGNQIRAIVMNEGKKNVFSPIGIQVAVYIYDEAGKVVFTKAVGVGGMSPGQSQEAVIDTGNFPIARKRYKVLVDPSSTIEESNDNNNETALINIPGPKIKINPLPPDHVTPPTFKVEAINSSPTPSQPKRTTYRLLVTNWEKFNPEWFISLENVLPPGPCGPGKTTNARLLVKLFLLENGSRTAVGCKPLNSPKDLQTVDFPVHTQFAESAAIQIAVVDTVPGGRSYTSNSYPIGLFGVAKILTVSGCKMLLGREGSYVCNTDQGFSMCEGLRNKGKPIECRRVGQK